MKNPLEIRKEKKAKQPNFKRQDTHKKARLAESWRKPRGLQSKMRLQKSGYRAIVKTGYGSPKSVRGADKSGLFPITVSNVLDLDKIDVKTQGALIASSVGKKKRYEIAKLAIEKKITLLNIKDPSAFVKSIEDSLQKKKKEKESRLEAKERKKKELEKKAEEKKKEEEKPRL